MPKFIVIKAHDGIVEGTEKCLPDSAVTRYMVENGFWRVVVDEAKADTPKKTNRPKRRTGK